MGIIYQLKENINNRIYIGSTLNFERRKMKHLYDLKNNNPTLYLDHLKTMSGLLGGANMLFSTQKQTSTESLISIDMDKMFMEKVYFQFEKFLDYFINRETKKYKFRFRFSGTNSYVDRKYSIRDSKWNC